MNPIIPLYVSAQTFVHAGAERVSGRVEHVVDAFKERRDRGATGIEYAALILVAAAVIGVLIGVVRKTLGPQFETAVTNLFKGGGGATTAPSPQVTPHQ